MAEGRWQIRLTDENLRRHLEYEWWNGGSDRARPDWTIAEESTESGFPLEWEAVWVEPQERIVRTFGEWPEGSD